MVLCSPRLVQFCNSTVPWVRKNRTIWGPPVQVKKMLSQKWFQSIEFTLNIVDNSIEKEVTSVESTVFFTKKCTNDFHHGTITIICTVIKYSLFVSYCLFLNELKTCLHTQCPKVDLNKIKVISYNPNQGLLQHKRPSPTGSKSARIKIFQPRSFFY